MGSREDVAAKIDKNTEIILAKMNEEVQNNKEKVKYVNSIELRIIFFASS